MPSTSRRDWKIWAGHCQTGSADKVYVVWIEQRSGQPNPYVVCGGYDKRLSSKPLKVDIKGQYDSLGAAEWSMNKVVSEKSKSYRNVEDGTYQRDVHLTNLTDLMRRIDCTRLVGLVDPAAAAAPAATPTPSPRKKAQAPAIGSHRAARDVEF